MLAPSLIAALRQLAARLDKQPVNWAITAGCGLALQGVPVEVRDIDLATNRAGAYRMADLFAAEIARPVRFSATEAVQSHYGAFVLAGFEVEIIGDVQYRGDDGVWSEPLDITPHKHYLKIDGIILPVLTLEYEYASYVRLGRTAKRDLLADFLGKR